MGAFEKTASGDFIYNPNIDAQKADMNIGANQQYVNAVASNDIYQQAIAERRAAEGDPVRYPGANDTLGNAFAQYQSASGSQAPQQLMTLAQLKPKVQPTVSRMGSEPTTGGSGTLEGGVQWPQAGAGKLLVTKNGDYQEIDSGDYKKIDALTRSGWQPVESSTNQPYKVVDYLGGQLFIGSDGVPHPLNEILGGQTTPEQQAALGNYTPFKQDQPGLPVRMPDGKIQYFNNIDENLNQALKAGGRPLDLNGGEMKVTNGVGGGYVVTDSDGNTMPLNVAMGRGWQPGQQEVIQGLTQSGWKPGESVPTQFQQPASTSDYVNPDQFGDLMKTWDQKFVAPTAEDARKTPGYQFQFDEAMKALERPFAATGMRSGAQLKALQDRAQNLADTTYGETYNRSLGEYQQNYNIFRNNQGDRFNRLAAISGIDQVNPTNALNSAQQTGGQAGQIIVNAGAQQGAAVQNAANARASGQVNAFNAVSGAVNGGLNNLSNLYMASRYFK